MAPTLREELLDFFSEPAFIVDGRGKLLQANESASELLAPLRIGGALGDRLVGGEQEMNTILKRCMRTTSRLPCSLALRSSSGPRRLQAVCRRLNHGGDGPQYAFSLRMGERNRFASLNKEIDDLHADIRERKRLEAALRVSLQRNELLFRELQHRVKNNIQTLMTMLHRQASSSRNEEFRALAQTAVQRLLAMSKAFETMYGTDIYSSVPADALIRSVVEAVRQTFGGDYSVKYAMDHQWEVPSAKAGALALIINEALTNAYKHGANGTAVSVEITLSGNGKQHVLTIRDKGPGFPEDFASSRSLGLALIRGLCSQLEARVEMRNEKGAVVTVIIPS